MSIEQGSTRGLEPSSDEKLTDILINLRRRADYNRRLLKYHVEDVRVIAANTQDGSLPKLMVSKSREALDNAYRFFEMLDDLEVNMGRVLGDLERQVEQTRWQLQEAHAEVRRLRLAEGSDGIAPPDQD